MSEAELNRDVESQGANPSKNIEPNCVAEDLLRTDRAEQMCSLRNVPVCPDTHTVTLCHTRTWPVARLVDIPVINSNLPILKTDFDQGRAEQMSRAEQECHASKKVMNSENYRYRTLKNAENAELRNAEDENIKKHETEDSSRRLDLPGRMENDRGMERVTEDAKMEKIKLLEDSWKEMRIIRTFLKTTCDWKDVDGKTARRMETENKKMKSDLMEMKRKKFGKAGKSTTTNLEEALFSVNLRKKMELEELRQICRSLRYMKMESTKRMETQDEVRRIAEETEDTK